MTPTDRDMDRAKAILQKYAITSPTLALALPEILAEVRRETIEECWLFLKEKGFRGSAVALRNWYATRDIRALLDEPKAEDLVPTTEDYTIWNAPGPKCKVCGRIRRSSPHWRFEGQRHESHEFEPEEPGHE